MPKKPHKPGKTAEDIIATKGLDFAISESNWGFKGHNYLFTIGIDTYQHWSPLKCAVKDVQDFIALLTNRYQFENDYVFTLFNEEGTQKNILHIFRQLAQKVTSEDNLIIYFSGHGHYDEVSKTGYWIPVDAETGHENEYQFLNTAIVVDRLRGINSLHTFLIIDACFSGTLISQIKSSPRSERFKSRRIFTSGRTEVVRDGPEGGNSPFAKGILNYLNHNTDKYIPASRLILSVMEYVEKEAQQTPLDARLVNADDQGGDFVFHLKMSEAEIWASVVSRNTKAAYQKFIEQFPQSEHYKEAQEAFDWLSASEINTIKSIHQFIIKHRPLGKYIPQAIKTLASLEEEKCWKETKIKDTLAAYFEYLQQYPEGKYIEEAKFKTSFKSEDDDDRAIQKAIEEDKPELFREYLQNPGLKKYQDIAKKKLSGHSAPSKGIDDPLQTEEDGKWEIIKTSERYLDLKDFLEGYPQSEHVEEVLRRMKQLDDIALNKIRMMEYNNKMPLQEKIKTCIEYFNDFPGAANNKMVKQIKDRLEIKRFGSRL